MSDDTPRADPASTGYQAEFFHRFVTELGPGSRHVLLSPVGSGQSFAVVSSVAELHRVGRLHRLLMLVPPALTGTWSFRLRQRGRNPVELGMRALRLAWEQSSIASCPWPAGIYLMSHDLAPREEARKLLERVAWELVVVDDAHGLGDEQRLLVEHLVARAPAPALLLATHVPGAPGGALASGATLIDWTEAVAAFRRETGAESHVVRVARSYHRSPEEIALFELVTHTANDLAPRAPQRARVLVDQAASSLRCLEDTLVRWQAGDALPTADVDALEPLLRAIETLHDDTKLACLMELLRELLTHRVRHIVVFSQFRATLEYVATAADSLGSRVHQFHDELAAGVRASLLETFSSDGGILVTSSVMAGVSLSFVTAVVHYDLPASHAAFSAREGRYHRFSRSEGCTVHFLWPSTGALPLEVLLRRITDKLAVGGAELWTEEYTLGMLGEVG